MFVMSSEIYEFYKSHVRLTKEQREQLIDYRDTNIDRLKDGLDNLECPHPAHIRGQGSIAMSTANQHPDNDYDIDTALIFKKADLPSSPRDARKRVEAAMISGGGNFTRPPEARTNAVTVWYQLGHHVDLAVHRINVDDFGNEVIEHAGAEWTPRDPTKIATWFNDLVNQVSPSKDDGATVQSGQMRRIVQLIKKFSRSRSSWTLPGGLVITSLVAECYVCDYVRDDIALYQTMSAIYNRLLFRTDVYNPVDRDRKLTYKDKYVNQVKQLRDKLGDAIRWLEPLFAADCTRTDAIKAWNTLFQHEYWDEILEIEEERALGELLKKASQLGSLYVASTGKIEPTQPKAGGLSVPPHRFYGEDK